MSKNRVRPQLNTRKLLAEINEDALAGIEENGDNPEEDYLSEIVNARMQLEPYLASRYLQAALCDLDMPYTEDYKEYLVQYVSSLPQYQKSYFIKLLSTSIDRCREEFQKYMATY